MSNCSIVIDNIQELAGALAFRFFHHDPLVKHVDFMVVPDEVRHAIIAQCTQVTSIPLPNERNDSDISELTASANKSLREHFDRTPSSNDKPKQVYRSNLYTPEIDSEYCIITVIDALTVSELKVNYVMYRNLLLGSKKSQMFQTVGPAMPLF